ncbi:MAG: AAA family ATPase, partial [Actinomycetota bacterium]|nr:AAA family ATPase [Actinomycetota bacterium]
MTSTALAPTPSQWPLVGRDGELRVLTELVFRPDSRGVVVDGPAGVGKTRLALECLRAAERSGLATARVAGTRTAVGMAYAAMAPLVAEPGPDVMRRDTADVLRQFAAAMAQRAGGARLVLMVDDAQYLDRSSATLLYQLAASGAAVLVVTLRTDEDPPEPITGLWRDGLLERFELEGLDGETIEQMLGVVLGGPISRAAVARLAARCRGNLLFLRELVLGALDTGVLAAQGGIWSLTGPLAPSPRLVELIEARMVSLGDGERLVLEALAASDSLGLAELTALADASAVDHLEAGGHMVRSRSGRRVAFHLAHPLYREVLEANRSVLRFRRLATTVADALEGTGARRQDDVLALARWRLDAGRADPELLLRGADDAWRRYDYPLA